MPLVRGDCTLLKRRSSNSAQWRHLRYEMQERAHAGGGFSRNFEKERAGYLLASRDRVLVGGRDD